MMAIRINIPLHKSTHPLCLKYIFDTETFNTIEDIKMKFSTETNFHLYNLNLQI